VVRGSIRRERMTAQMHRLDTIANNLANVDLNGYKRDTTITKRSPNC